MKMSPGIWAFGNATPRFDAARHPLDGHGSYCVVFDPHRAGYREYAAIGA